MEKKINKNIWKLFFKKNSIVFSSNLFLPLFVIIASSSIVFFLWEEVSIGKYIIWIVAIIIYWYIFFNRNRPIVSSVWLYKYNEIFSEIIKNVIFQKKYLRNAKNIWRQIK